ARPVNKDDQDLSSELDPDQDETLRLGVPAANGSQRNLFLLIGGGVLAVCLLAFAIYQLVPKGNTTGPIAQNDKKDQTEKDKDQEKTTPATKEKTGGDKTKATDTPPPKEKDKEKPKDGEKDKEKCDITLID